MCRSRVFPQPRPTTRAVLAFVIIIGGTEKTTTTTTTTPALMNPSRTLRHHQSIHYAKPHQQTSRWALAVLRVFFSIVPTDYHNNTSYMKLCMWAVQELLVDEGKG